MLDVSEIRKTAYKYGIKNAALFGGKTNVGAMVGKVMALHKGIKANEVMGVLNEVVAEINGMKLSEIQATYHRIESEEGFELKPKEKVPGLPTLDWAENGEAVVVRIAPNPSGPLHFGHIRTIIPNWEYAKKYHGKFILRLDDTDPKVKKPVAGIENEYIADLHWLGVDKIEKVYRASDHLPRYYEVVDQLLEKDGVYVCTCKSEDWKACIDDKKACPCRDKPVEEQRAAWNNMKSHALKEGKAVMRLKTDLNHPDPSQRDYAIMKIVDKPDHPNTNALQYHVWPLYNFASAVDDHDLGTTLIIRGQEHAQNQTKQEFIYNYFGWTYPHTITVGRIRLEGGITSKSKIKAGIDKGDLEGFDDPRIGNLTSLKKRGIKAEAITKMIINLGLNANDSTVSIDALYDANRALIDSDADRASFIEEEEMLEVSFCPKMESHVPLHPDFPEKGSKVYELQEGSEKFLIPKEDAKKLKMNQVVRLRHAYNIKITGMEKGQVFAQFVGQSKQENIPTIHWILPDLVRDIEITMPDAKKTIGKTESMVADKKAGEYVMLEHFGYVRITEQGKVMTHAWFTHR